MKKSRLYILFSLLTIILILTTAATCNLCGIPIEIGEEQQTETKKDIEDKTEKAAAEQEDDTSPKSEESKTANHKPVIEKVLMGGMDVRVMKAAGTLSKVPSGVQVEFPFSIEAYDEDGDELQYSAYDSLGKYFKVEKIDDDLAIFHWNSPGTTGPYELTIEVSDGKGGVDTYTINMTIVKMEEPLPEEGGEIL